MLEHINLEGESGVIYPFEVYDTAQEFESEGAVYVFTRRWLSGDRAHHQFVYIGRTGDMSERFDNHHKMSCIEENVATHIGVHWIQSEMERIDVEK